MKIAVHRLDDDDFEQYRGLGLFLEATSTIPPRDSRLCECTASKRHLSIESMRERFSDCYD